MTHRKVRVFFGDLPMDKINPEVLMSHISMVFQDVYLFQDTGTQQHTFW